MSFRRAYESNRYSLLSSTYSHCIHGNLLELRVHVFHLTQLINHSSEAAFKLRKTFCFFTCFLFSIYPKYISHLTTYMHTDLSSALFLSVSANCYLSIFQSFLSMIHPRQPHGLIKTFAYLLMPLTLCFSLCLGLTKTFCWQFYFGQRRFC